MDESYPLNELLPPPDYFILRHEPAGHFSWPESFRLPKPMLSVTRFLSALKLLYKEPGLLYHNRHLLHFTDVVEIKRDQVTAKHLHALRLLSTQFVIQSVEHWCYSEDLELYGRIDLLVRDFEGKVYLVEVKTTKKVTQNEVLQGALYLLILAVERYPSLQSDFFLIANYHKGKMYLQRVYVNLDELYTFVKNVQNIFKGLLSEEN